jgi:hypothetical protein
MPAGGDPEGDSRPSAWVRPEPPQMPHRLLVTVTALAFAAAASVWLGRTTSAQSNAPGRYTMLAASSEAHSSNVWVLDSQTGEIRAYSVMPVTTSGGALMIGRFEHYRPPQ